MASGRRSRRSTSSSSRLPSPSVSARDARARNRATASSTGSCPTRTSSSPGRSRARREVATRGTVPRHRPTSSPALGSCSRLSRTSSTSGLPASAARMSAFPDGSPRARETAASRSSLVRHATASHHTALPLHRAATARARRVLPMPPGPVSVTSPPWATTPSAASSSSSRPTIASRRGASPACSSASGTTTGAGSNRYPWPWTVRMWSGSPGSRSIFLRSRRTVASTALLTTPSLYPQTSVSSSSRDTTTPGRSARYSSRFSSSAASAPTSSPRSNRCWATSTVQPRRWRTR